MVIQEDEADDLLETVDRGLKQLRYGALSLLQVEADMPQRVLNILIENFEVDEDVVARTQRAAGLRRLARAHQAAPAGAEGSAVHAAHALGARRHRQASSSRSPTRTSCVHHPFDSFTSVETFLRAAVDDPQVVAIKMTLYRIGANSPLVDLLIEAAEAGQAGRGARRAEGPLRRAQQHRLGDAARSGRHPRRLRAGQPQGRTASCAWSCARRPTASGATRTSARATTTASRRRSTPTSGCSRPTRPSSTT